MICFLILRTTEKKQIILQVDRRRTGDSMLVNTIFNEFHEFDSCFVCNILTENDMPLTLYIPHSRRGKVMSITLLPILPISQKRWFGMAGQRSYAQIQLTKRSFMRLGFMQIEHQPYSPDMIPNNFSLFSHLKKELRVRISKSKEKLTKINKFLSERNMDFFKSWFETIVDCWRK